MKIDQLADEFEKQAKEEAQLTIESQMKVLVATNKKIKILQEENEHLKKLLKQTNPIIVNLDEAGLDEELIARSELRKLRQRSQDQELSMEETKKVEIYSKIMSNLANKPKTIEVTAKNMKTEELFGLLNEATSEEK